MIRFMQGLFRFLRINSSRQMVFRDRREILPAHAAIADVAFLASQMSVTGDAQADILFGTRMGDIAIWRVGNMRLREHLPSSARPQAASMSLPLAILRETARTTSCFATTMGMLLSGC
jgi:hypothetical protein